MFEAGKKFYAPVSARVEWNNIPSTQVFPFVNVAMHNVPKWSDTL